MQGKIVTKIGLMVLVGWLVGACKACPPEGETLVDVKVTVEGSELFLVGGASGTADKSSFPKTDDGTKGLYKTPKTVAVGTDTIVKFITGRNYFVYATAAKAKEDVQASTIDNKQIAFSVSGAGKLLLKGQKGAFVAAGFSSMPVELSKGTLPSTPEFTLKQGVTDVATLPADASDASKGNATITDNVATFTLVQKGLRATAAATKDKDPTISLGPLTLPTDLLTKADDGKVLAAKDAKIVVTVTKVGISAKAAVPAADATPAVPEQDYVAPTATATFEKKSTQS